MHEASLMKGLMREVLAIASREGAARVVGLKVRLGALSHMSPEHFQEHFDVASAGTIAEGARIEAVEDPEIASPTAADVLLESLEIG